MKQCLLTDMLEYANLLSFACDRSSASVMLDLFVANPNAAHDTPKAGDLRDEFYEISEAWDANRDRWLWGVQDEDLVALMVQRKELVEQVYRIEEGSNA